MAVAPDDDPQPVPRVVATPAALAFLAELQAEHGAVLFHQSGGCCDGSSPMCYPQGEFRIGAGDLLLGQVGGAPVYIGRAQGEAWAHTQLILDVVPGRGGMFSLDNGRERRFLARGRVFGAQERPAPLTSVESGRAHPVGETSRAIPDLIPPGG